MIQDISEIKMQRMQLGITQNELAKKSGVSQSLIAKIESGRIDPAFSKVKQISNALSLLSKPKEVSVREIMVQKVVSVSPEVSIGDAIKKMKKYGISQMPVIDDGKSVGLVSEKIILASMTEGKPHYKVAEVMTDAVPQVPLDADVGTATKLLASYQLLLVAEKGKIKGLVTRSDILQKAFK